jgi:hypothetical protein
MKNNGKSHGGARSGAGRRAEVRCTRRITLSIDDETALRARQIGNGNVSAGIRRAVREFGVSMKSSSENT